MSKYYDGHYKDSELTLEEIEKLIAMEEKKCEELKEWPSPFDDEK